MFFLRTNKNEKSDMGLIVLIGLSGSGKTTFCKDTEENISILLGDLLWQKKDLAVESCMRSGILVPSIMWFSVLKDTIGHNEMEENF